MASSRPFTLLAALIFTLMALVHAYRLATHFQFVVGSHVIPLWVSWAGVAIAAIMAVMLYREATR